MKQNSARGGRLAVGKCTLLMMTYQPSWKTYFHLPHVRFNSVAASDRALKLLKGFVSVKYIRGENKRLFTCCDQLKLAINKPSYVSLFLLLLLGHLHFRKRKFSGLTRGTLLMKFLQCDRIK